jgi:hypothetical protein
MILNGFFEVMVFTNQEADIAGDVLLAFLAPFDDPLDIPHDIAIDLLVANLLIEPSFEHLPLVLEVFDFGYVVPVLIEPPIDFEGAGQWLVRHDIHG